MAADSYGRRDRLIQEKRHDAYQEQGKWAEGTVCTECNALYSDGRWSWKETEQSVNKVICPACRRIAERYPAGYIEISGPFSLATREEILSLVHHVEQQEKSEHPMERIVSVTDEKNHVLIITTGTHVARRIGEALCRSYKGEFSCKYSEGEDVVRLSWQR
jgi:NMD protein affecting ribosome stability and mRNA decay